MYIYLESNDAMEILAKQIIIISEINIKFEVLYYCPKCGSSSKWQKQSENETGSRKD